MIIRIKGGLLTACCGRASWASVPGIGASQYVVLVKRWSHPHLLHHQHESDLLPVPKVQLKVWHQLLHEFPALMYEQLQIALNFEMHCQMCCLHHCHLHRHSRLVFLFLVEHCVVDKPVHMLILLVWVVHRIHCLMSLPVVKWGPFFFDSCSLQLLP
jgi:hypothetical protein